MCILILQFHHWKIMMQFSASGKFFITKLRYTCIFHHDFKHLICFKKIIIKNSATWDISGQKINWGRFQRTLFYQRAKHMYILYYHIIPQLFQGKNGIFTPLAVLASRYWLRACQVLRSIFDLKKYKYF